MGYKRFLCIHKIVVASTLIGILISIWHFVEGVLLWNNPAYNIPENVYISWIGGTLFFPQSYWFFLVLPLFASVSVGIEYGKLRKQKYFYQIKSRMSKMKYTCIYGIRFFLIGFMTIIIPLFLNLFLTMMVKPMLFPEPLVAIGPYANEIGAITYYAHPMLFTIGYIILDGIFAGITSLLTIVICNVIENYILATLIPFILYYAISMISSLFNNEALSLNIVLTPGIGVKNLIGYYLMIIIGVITLISWIMQCYKGDL